ncbi:hypothetical protein [Helicobacter suis]|uniref:hypothetical protein n=1 Tax=Helicobacter suis TaxID=104628 RepID=UPI001F07D97E|nr:hypothetical protein [Helicobacter suis]
MVAEAWQDARSFHAFLMALGPIVFGINLVFLGLVKNYATLNKCLYFMMPMVFAWVAMAFFSGIFLLAMQSFALSGKVALMGLVVGIVMLGEIMRVYKLKLARTKESLMLAYIKWSKGLYGLDLLLCLLVYIL